MPQGPQYKRPLLTVLEELSWGKLGLVLAQGTDYYRIEQVAGRARREAKSGHPSVQAYLSAPNFWWDEDPDGKVVVFEQTSAGPRPIAAEVGSRSIPLALVDEGEWGHDSMLSGSLGKVEIQDPVPKGKVMGIRRKVTRAPEYRALREGFWRMIQRVHRGIPGLVGTGRVGGGQFTGGAAGITTGWVLKPNSTSSMIDAIPIAGFYAFGPYWAQIIRLAELPDNFSEITRALDLEFGITSDRDLERGTVPNPEAGPSMGKPMAVKAADMVKGPQFETNVDGTHFRVVYTKHFVDRYLHDEGSRPAVAQFMDAEMVREEIEKALPQVREMLEADPYAQGIIVSKPYGLSMKFFAIPIDDGWQLNFATQIIALPLWRTSDREVEIVVNPVVDVRFEDDVPEDLQVTLLADLAPRFMELAPGEEEMLTGELVSALIRHGAEGFSIQNVEWKEAWEPLYI